MISVILAGLCATAAAALFRGTSGELISLVPLAVAMGFSTGTLLFPGAILLFSLCLLSPSALPWAILTGSLLFSLAGRGKGARVSGFLMAVCILWFVPIQYSVPLLIVSAAGAFFHKGTTGVYLAAAAAFVLSAFLVGLPSISSEEPAIALCRIENRTVQYEPEHLYTSRREVWFPAPVSGSWLMWLALDPGGVRDTLPMVAVSIGEEMVFLPSGPDTLCFTFHPGDTLRVRLMRDFRPFTHPAVHLSAGGEQL